MISLTDVAVGYREKTVLRRVSFRLSKGEFAALIGLNGSGKTTLLKAAAGLLPIKSGRCETVGQDIVKMDERARAKLIAYIPQQRSRLRGVAVLDAVLMGLHPALGFFSFPSENDQIRAQAVLTSLGLGALAGEDFSKLSEGQKQMVILARTLVQNAKILLLDEPDTALDFPARHRMLKKIRQLIRAEEKTGLITLHDPNLALQYCDRLIALRDGEIVSDITLAGARRAGIENCFSAIYGEISMIENQGRYIVTAPGNY